MKRKIPALLLLLLALMTAFHAVSSADEPGFFGLMARDEFADERLSILDQVAEKVSVSVTADNGISFEVGGTSITLTALSIAAIAGILLNIILPGNDYTFGVNLEGDINRGIGMNPYAGNLDKNDKK